MAKQAFRCGNPDDMDEDDFWDVEARDAGEAAEMYAEDHDSNSAEYPDRQTVIVIHPDGQRSRFVVVGETVRRYTAYDE